MSKGILAGALRAEWSKFRTTTGPVWLLLAAVTLTIALSTAAIATASCPTTGCAVDTTKLSLTGTQIGQALVAVLAVLTISTEYSTGLIRTTLTAIPHRIAVLAAKAAVLTGPTLLAGAFGAGGSILAGRLILPGHGFTTAHGYPPLSLTGPTLRAASGSALYLVLIGLLSLGIAALVRDSAASIGVVLGLLYLLPILLPAFSDPTWQRHLQQIGPSTAGLTIEATTGLQTMPLSPWAGLGVLAIWAAVALLAGAAALRWRNA